MSTNPVASPTGPGRTPPPPTATPEPERPLAARVNGQPIYLADYERQVAQYQAALVASGENLSSPEVQQRLLQMRKQILDWMIEQVLLEQAAAGMGITVTEEEIDAEIARLVADAGSQEEFSRRLERSGMTLQDLRAQLRADLIRNRVLERVRATVPSQAEQVHARHILVDTPELAQRILAQLQSGADFAQLARLYSQDESTRDAGGDLGWFPRGVLLAPEVEEAAFALQAGQISQVVRSAFGYHIVQTLERAENRPISPENLQLLQEQTVQRWIESLWNQAVIERYVE
ncbi:MAG: peptidylprolyl isomerase [Anaerolineae bacterium]|nr:peptidylprolyl isomerase [Anaerolineae bacterium]MDW7992831.1 peptidylprolyl isomerase [Anaerolineae bacterium]